MEQPQLTQTMTKQAVDTSTRLVLGIGMISAFAVGISLSMALLNINLLAEEAPEIITLKKPFKVSDIWDGALTTDAQYNNNLVLYATDSVHNPGYQEPLGKFFLHEYQDGSAYASTYRLAISNDDAYIAGGSHASIATILTGTGVHTLCVPPALDDPYVWFDANGNPYDDYDLSGNALTDCVSVKNRAYAPYIIDSATINQPYESNSQIVELKKDGAVLAAVVDGQVETYSSSETLHGGAPLYVSLETTDIPRLLPSRTIQVISGGIQTLCIPPTNISNTPTQYYFNSDGWPYRDPLLTQSVRCVKAIM